MDKADFNKISKLKEIELDKLHIQYIPMSRLERYYKKTNGHNLMSLVYSPHVEIMNIFNNHDFEFSHYIHSLMSSRYAKERLNRRKLGMKEWNKKHLLKHFRTRYETFKCIKKFGFEQDWCYDRKKKRDRSILVCKKPFWSTRFDVEIDGVKGWEIYNGAGRAATMLVLGYKTIPGYFIEDAQPGSKKWKRVTKRFK